MRNWYEMSNNEKDTVKEEYNIIKKQIRSLANIKVNREKKQKYSDKELELYIKQKEQLQQKYNEFELYCTCNSCGKIINIDNKRLKDLLKNYDKKLYCTSACAARQVGKEYKQNVTEEQKQIINQKISNTLKNREISLTDEQKQLKVERLNSYWKDLTPEQRSIRNKANAIKGKHTKLERYGNENYNNIEQIKQTVQEKYGVINTFQLESAKEKARKVTQEKYGVNKFFENQELYKQISLDRYGTEHPMQNQEIKNKLNNTKFLNWGNVNYNNQEKFERTFKQKYGVTRPFHLKKFIDKSKQTKLKRYGNANYNNRQKALNTIYNKYGKDYYDNLFYKMGCNRISKLNKSFATFIGSTDLEFPLDKYSYDIKKDNYLVELDPTITHHKNDIFLYNKFGGVEKTYHLDKSNTARANGYDCIHIFDWDDWEKISYMLQDKEILYARKLHIKEVDKDECSDFLNKYHIQNNCRGQEVRLGLYDDNKLVQIMTFGKPRYNKNYEWELLRLCSHKDYKIVGGAKRLFTHFITDYKPNSIISYCDYSKFTGDVYKELGFKCLGNSEPSKHWSKNDKHITDNLLRQRGYDQLFKTNYGKGTSNEQLMLENGWLPIYDCGQLTFVWIK